MPTIDELLVVFPQWSKSEIEEVMTEHSEDDMFLKLSSRSLKSSPKDTNIYPDLPPPYQPLQ